MADQGIKCRFLLKDPLQSTLDTVKEYPRQLREQWYEAIIECNISTSNGGPYNLQSFILDPNGGIEVKHDPTDSDTTSLSADYVTLSAALAALGENEQMTTLNPTEAIEALHRIRLSGENIPLPLHHHAAAVLERLKDTSAWIRANPNRTAGIGGGITISLLACATPAVLNAVGFSSIGPVAGSAAAAWQASIGSVAAGTLFSFLQGAAMGGAALGVITSIGAAGAAVAVATALLSSEKVRKVAKAVRNFVEGVVNGIAEKVKGFFGWLWERRD